MTEARFSNSIGRYVTIRVQRDDYRVFFSEAGEGDALVCQHAGGLHNHQWRHLLEDLELGAQRRIVAIDLPMHGKSDPPSSRRWWEVNRPGESGDFPV